MCRGIWCREGTIKLFGLHQRGVITKPVCTAWVLQGAVQEGIMGGGGGGVSGETCSRRRFKSGDGSAQTAYMHGWRNWICSRMGKGAGTLQSCA